MGDTTVVEAVILRGSSEALQQESARQGREIHATIKVERVMQADLNGIKFTIAPPEADNREWKPTSRPEWSWQITPNTSGSQTLSLRIMGLINVNGMSTGTDFESLNREVEVTQTFGNVFRGLSALLGGQHFMPSSLRLEDGLCGDGEDTEWDTINERNRMSSPYIGLRLSIHHAYVHHLADLMLLDLHDENYSLLLTARW